MSQREAGGEERPGGLPRSGSTSRLSAQAPEFVRIFPRPPPPAAFFVAGLPPPFEYYAVAVGPGGGGGGFGPAIAAEQEAEAEMVARDGIFDDVVHKVQK
jgi:La-related protein 7